MSDKSTSNSVMQCKRRPGGRICTVISFCEDKGYLINDPGVWKGYVKAKNFLKNWTVFQDPDAPLPHERSPEEWERIFHGPGSVAFRADKNGDVIRAVPIGIAFPRIFDRG
ncbi:MAG: hypothetical protein MUP21_01225 [Dehalococcoidia bacterium]|nr:hypothetical protein [Dehalococcoidia bacterium]